MVFDDTEPVFSDTRFVETDWAEYYPNAQEVIPKDMPEPRGNEVTTTCFVDADHAGCRATRRSHTGVIIMVNRAPIIWYSKRQNTVETSTFGSEFVAMRIAMEKCKALRYKLRMFGIPLDGETMMLGDNESAVKSASLVERRLNKKHNAICFHAVREAVAAGWLKVGKEPTETNIADLFTKLLPPEKRNKLLECILWWLIPQEEA